MKIKTLILLFGLTIFAEFQLFSQTSGTKNYVITFSRVAKRGIGGPNQTDIISGKVVGRNLNLLQIVIYTKAGGKWWVQPTTENPYTAILTDSTWQNEIHLGNQYAILIVTRSFIPQNTYTTLPQIDTNVKAVEIINARD